MKKLFLTTMQRALNAYLSLDGESSARIGALQGKVATMELLPLAIIFQLRFTPEGIMMTEHDTLPSDVKITGTPLRLVSMMLATDKKPFFTHDIKVEGDPALGQQIIDVFDHLEIDWEEHLSSFVGDIPAHQVGQITKRITHWWAKTRGTLRQNTVDYLHEETQLFPAQEALHDFFAGIDQLRMDLDRLEARIKLLQQNNEGTP